MITVGIGCTSSLIEKLSGACFLWERGLCRGGVRAAASRSLSTPLPRSAGSRLTWQAVGSLDYDLTSRTVLRAGWRYLSVDKKSGNVGVDLGFNGPFVSATFRF